MKKEYFLLLVALLFTIAVMAQAPANNAISGKLIDKVTEEPVELANVRILKKSDSTFVTGRASDAKGAFTIPVRNGEYIVHISFIGYNDVFLNVQVTPSTPTVQLGVIPMSNDNILLSETVVTAKASEIAVRGDTLEYNADSYKVTESAVVEDLLKKMPGVEIDKDGKIINEPEHQFKHAMDGISYGLNDLRPDEDYSFIITDSTPYRLDG